MTEVLGVLLIAVLLALVVWFVGAPLRRPSAATERPSDARRALEAAKAAKYSEIRDAELDREIDRQLRAEAVEILHALDELR